MTAPTTTVGTEASADTSAATPSGRPVGGFTVLDCRSDYSGHGWARVDELADTAAAAGQQALALTDDSLAGAWAFQRACHTAGIKPVIGLTIPLLDDPYPAHVTVYVTGGRGWPHLLALANSLAALRLDQVSFTDRAETLAELLGGGNTGLTLSTGGAGGVLPQLIGTGQAEAADWLLQLLTNTLPGRVLIEFHPALDVTVAGRLADQVSRHNLFPLVTVPVRYGPEHHASRYRDWLDAGTATGNTTGGVVPAGDPAHAGLPVPTVPPGPPAGTGRQLADVWAQGLATTAAIASLAPDTPIPACGNHLPAPNGSEGMTASRQLGRPHPARHGSCDPVARRGSGTAVGAGDRGTSRHRPARAGRLFPARRRHHRGGGPGGDRVRSGPRLVGRVGGGLPAGHHPGQPGRARAAAGTVPVAGPP